MDAERIRELRAEITRGEASHVGSYVYLSKQSKDDLLALLEEAQIKAGDGPRIFPRVDNDATLGGPPPGLSDADPFAKQRKEHREYCDAHAAPPADGRVEISGVDFTKPGTRLVCHPLAPPAKTVSREWVLQFIPCDCIDAYKDRGLVQPDCRYHNSSWEEMLEALGITVEEEK